MKGIYKNSTELMQLSDIPVYMHDLVDACLRGRLNLFLIGDTGSGKTQLARDAMSYFGAGLGDAKFAKDVQKRYGESLGVGTNLGLNATKYFPEDKTLFVLGRNDMDTRELFQRFNLHKMGYKPKYDLEPIINTETSEVEWYYPVFSNGIFTYQKITPEQAKVVRSKLEQLVGSTEEIRELTSKINTNLIVVDELPNCVPAVRAQLFNLFDGFIEVDGKPYSIGGDYSVGIATGNLGQKFTESSNDLGRALKDRMHVIVDVDYFHPTPLDTLEILDGNTNPRVEFDNNAEDRSKEVITKYKSVSTREIPIDKLIFATYLVHGLDYCSKGSKRTMKDAWPTQLENHEQGSDVGLILPLSIRAAKSVLRLSQSLDDVVQEKAGSNKINNFNSMVQAFKLVSAYSGVLNEAAVQNVYSGNNYAAIDAVIASTKEQFKQQAGNIAAGIQMIQKGQLNDRILSKFTERWGFMKDLLTGLYQKRGE